MRICVLLLILALCASQASSTTIDFEDLTTGTSYFVGQVFQSGGVTISLDALSSSWGGGSCSIDQRGYAGGSGNEAFIGNVMLNFHFGSISQLSLLFGNYGGYNRIEVNGDALEITNLLTLDGITLGGVNASVTQSAPTGNVWGSLSLSGPINSFAIGGQELVIDNVTVVPEPSAVLSLFAGSVSFIGIGRAFRRRK